MYITIREIHQQSMKWDTQSWCTGATLKDGMGRKVGGGFRMGTHVHPWLTHVNVRQTHHNNVKQLASN